MAEQKTDFAPPGRADRERLIEQHRRLRSDPALRDGVGRLSGLVLVVNRERQVVFASRGAEDLAAGDPLGLRPGELLGCIHSAETAGGCGTTSSCRLCGAVRAILEALDTDRPAEAECVLNARQRETAGTFRVTATPFAFGEDRFVLTSFEDISQQKRKAALERIFFHDILNTASSLKVYLDLIRRTADGGAPLPFLGEIESITDSLIEEIRSQKMLVAAENGTLAVRKDFLDSRSLLEEAAASFRPEELTSGKRIAVAPFTEVVGFVSDAAILRRVLVNALKNALEASPDGATVTLGFARQGERLCFRVHNPGAIPEEARPLIFSRWFSTKGENRGLGTYSMKLLTEEYLGGEVSFDSRPGEGTTFLIELPYRPD